MGPKFTEGAIVQHLAKLRGIMAKNNIPVPPPLKRGMITKTPSKIYNNANNKRVLEPITPMHPGTPEVPDEYKSIYDKSKATPQDGESAPAKPKARGRAKARRNMSDEDDEDEPLPELFDSDGDTGVPVKKRRRVAKPKGASAAMEVDDPPSTPSSQMIKVEPESASSIKIEQEEASIINDTAGNSVGPASRTRGLKRDYAVLQRLPSDDETEEEGSESEDADDDDVPVDDDEELIRALLTADAEDTGSAATWTPQFPLVGHASYGQVQMNGVAQANHAHGSVSQFTRRRQHAANCRPHLGFPWLDKLDQHVRCAQCWQSIHERRDDDWNDWQPRPRPQDKRIEQPFSVCGQYGSWRSV